MQYFQGELILAHLKFYSLIFWYKYKKENSIFHLLNLYVWHHSIFSPFLFIFVLEFVPFL